MERLPGPFWNSPPVRFQARTLGTIVSVALLLALLGGVWG